MRTLIFAILALVSLTAHATITIAIDANLLKSADGSPMPASGLVVLVASTGDSIFNGPTPTAFASGDDRVVAKWDLTSFQQPGVLNDSAGGLQLINGWKQGDPLRLYWYPTLTKSSTAPGQNTPYGTYTDAAGIDGSFAWTTPGDAAYISLKFLTTDANADYDVPGSNSPDAGLANLTVSGPPAPPSLAIQLLGGGTVGIHLTGVANGNYALQYVNSLLNTNNNWLSLSNGTADSNGVLDFTDTVGATPRFYRSQVLP